MGDRGQTQARGTLPPPPPRRSSLPVARATVNQINSSARALSPSRSLSLYGWQVKNKQPAPMQVTAEQILREARERQEDENYTAPAQKITDPEELAVYRLKERKHFEDRLRMSRNAMGTWLKYAAFEEAQRDFDRARSVYERAVDVDHRNTTLWLKYAEMEMRNRHINAARNVWDRAVTLMPRVDQFWFKYIYMEEMLGNITGARGIFDRWVEWEPDDHAWSSYVRLELRANHPERARTVFERWVLRAHRVPCHTVHLPVLVRALLIPCTMHGTGGCSATTCRARG